MASTDRQNGRESNLTSLEQPSSPIVYDLRQELRVAAHSHELHEVEDEEDLIFDENDKIRILDAGHGGEGWWYDWDENRSIPRGETYRLFIPRTLENHPDYLAPSDKKAE